jgi:uncharacterized SAM-binding protein YcdF (DUF218 family)
MADDTPPYPEPPSVAEPGDGRVAAWVRGWSWRRTVALVLGVLVLYYAVNVMLVVRAGRTDEAAPVDAIVVLGAAQYDGRASPQLAARLDHVVTLWGRGLARYVVVTGGKQPGDRFTEAAASRDYLVARGVPDGAILSEDTSHNTYDSLAAAADLLAAQGLDRVLLVTDPFHAARAELIADEVGLEARSSPTPTSVVTGWSSTRGHLKEAAGVALGRIIDFRRLTDLTG